MDRIEFIEMLQERLDEQRKVYEELEKEKQEKYKYTTKYLYEQIQPKEHISMGLTLNDNAININPLWDSNNKYTESKKTTTELIIEQSYKIRKLEMDCEELRKEIEAFDDVRTIFPFLEEK